ncbi:cytochrome c peroxidase [Porticoccaceae bacterium LTM1]|nr:cytochrome c peroxidase [Porticoccaceae bacterium LTM1]
MKRKALYVPAIGVLLAGALMVWRSPTPPPVTTPLSGFSAPFVFGHFTVPDDNPLTNEGFELGRRLFYDTKLSANNTVACATCHLQELAFTDGKRTAVGISGKPLDFNSMSLVNLMWGPQHFFWNGRAASLEDQALTPIQDPNEMGQNLDELVRELEADPQYPQLFAAAYGDITPQNIAKALATFQRALVSDNSKYDQYLRGELKLSEQEELGRKLFMAHPDVKVSLRGGNCIDCHSQFLTSGFNTLYDGFSNNGLDDEQHLRPGLQTVTNDPNHRGMFKVPSLRNIAVTAPYMHDGRFATLEEVLEHYDNGVMRSNTLSPLIAEATNLSKGQDAPIELHLSDAEKQAIIAFLHTLTDQSLLTNPDFANPFSPANPAADSVPDDQPTNLHTSPE